MSELKKNLQEIKSRSSHVGCGNFEPSPGIMTLLEALLEEAVHEDIQRFHSEEKRACETRIN